MSWFPYAFRNKDIGPDLQALHDDCPDYFRIYVLYMLRKRRN